MKHDANLHCRLSKHVFQNLAMHIGKPTLNTIVVEGEFRVIEPKQMEDRCLKVINSNGVLARKITYFV